ncbi:MAG: acetyl-CoA carboxylase biotin carboxyl carrier protein [Thermoanaerobaculia bacterium]
MLTYDQIKELIQIVSERHLHELEIERSGFRLKITGAAAAAQPAEMRADPAAGAAAPVVSREAPPTAEARGGQPAQSAAQSALHLIASPIVGTFYGSPSPTAEPFVRVGDRVRKGQVLCIVEAMKLMNEIECDVDGIVAEIHPRNAQPVEFGEPLYGIRPE